MLSPYRIQQNNIKKRTKKVSNTNFDNNPHHELDLKRPPMTSNDLAKPRANAKSNRRNQENKKRSHAREY